MCSTWNFLRPDFRTKNGENSPRGAVTLQRSGFFSTFNITTSYFPSLFFFISFPRFAAFCFVRFLSFLSLSLFSFFLLFSPYSLFSLLCTRLFWRKGGGVKHTWTIRTTPKHHRFGDNVNENFVLFFGFLVSFSKLAPSFEIEFGGENCRKLLILCHAMCATRNSPQPSLHFKNGFKRPWIFSVPKSPKSYDFSPFSTWNFDKTLFSSIPLDTSNCETFQTIPLTTPEKGGGGLFKPYFYNSRSRSRVAAIDTLFNDNWEEEEEGGRQSLAEEVFQRIVVAIARNLSSWDRLRMAQLSGLPPCIHSAGEFERPMVVNPVEKFERV